MLGINMGHVGFLAEIERDDMDDAVRRVIARDYRVEERMALSVRVKDADGEVVYETWALNEATVEKASRERMLEVVIEVDGRPLSTFGCDGVVMSTPTGSTAYNFSAGGPVVWPTVEAIAVVPLSAHALFARPLVVGPEARRSRSRCSSARTAPASCGATAAAPTTCRRAPASSCAAPPSRAPRPAASGRLHRSAGAQVPPAGRGMARPASSLDIAAGHRRRGALHVPKARVIEEMRLRDLGVIAEADLPIGPGFTAITGETGAGKTMVVTGLGLLLGQRADSGAVRSGAEQAAVEGVWIVPRGGPRRRARARGRGRRSSPSATAAASCYVARTLTSEGRSRASVGGRAAPAGVLADLADRARRRARAVGSAAAALGRGAARRARPLRRRPCAAALRRVPAAYEAWRTIDDELTMLTEERDAARREAAAAASDDRGDRGRRPAARRGRGARTRARSAWPTPRSSALAAASAREALSSEEDAPDVSGLLGESRRAARARRRPRPGGARGAARRARVPRRRYRDRTGGYLADLDESGPHELAAVEDRRAELGVLVRAHGSLDAAIALLETGSARLAELDDDGDRIERLNAERQAAASTLDARAAALTDARTEAAGRLAAAVTEELHALAMPDAGWRSR